MLKNLHRGLRKNQTNAESLLWYYLRNRTLDGLKFRRQHVLNGYIVDFVCLEKKLVIELDGSHHANQISYDEIRTQKLQEDGFRVLRFWNNDVMDNMEGVWEVIHYHCNERSK